VLAPSDDEWMLGVSGDECEGEEGKKDGRKKERMKGTEVKNTCESIELVFLNRGPSQDVQEQGTLWSCWEGTGWTRLKCSL
jgi:hypothetical protein